MAYRIFLSPPKMGGLEQKYVQECFDTNWIAPYGPQLGLFEQEMAAYVGMESALAVTAGTAAIHLALRWFNVQPGDIVFCSDFTFAGSCNPIIYLGAEPVFIDSEPDSWNMSPVALKKAYEWAEKEGKLPKAIIIVDLYGESAAWDQLVPICRSYGTPIIEDAAEALGSQYKNRRCGACGDISVLSFNGNKIVTTSGGGMVLCDDQVAIEKMRFWSTQAREPFAYYEHKEYGFNYRLSNVCAAIGRGQLASLDDKVRRRNEIHQRYTEALTSEIAYIKQITPACKSNCWLSMLCIKDDRIKPLEIITWLHNAGIEARPAWKPMHQQPLYQSARSFSHFDDRYVSTEVFNRALCLPSGDGMTDEEVDIVIKEVKAFIVEALS